jgi:hypothetical protein
VALSIRKKLALTSLTSGGRSVGIVRLRTEATEFFLIVIGFITGCLVDMVAVKDDDFILLCNFHVPLALKDKLSVSGAGCDIALVFIFLCVGLMAVFCGVMSHSGFLSIGVYFVVSQSWCGVSGLLVEFWLFRCLCRFGRSTILLGKIF